MMYEMGISHGITPKNIMSLAGAQDALISCLNQDTHALHGREVNRRGILATVPHKAHPKSSACTLSPCGLENKGGHQWPVSASSQGPANSHGVSGPLSLSSSTGDVWYGLRTRASWPFLYLPLAPCHLQPCPGNHPMPCRGWGVWCANRVVMLVSILGVG